jgi:hypothetical protein
MDKQDNKKIKAKRADNLHLEVRHKQVALLIMGGYAKRAFLMQKIAETYPEWNVNERQIDNYIREARELIKNTYTEDDLALEKDIALSRMDSLYVMNIKIQDYRECRNLIADRMKMLGLYAPEKFDHTSKGDKIENKIDFLFPPVDEIINEED